MPPVMQPALQRPAPQRPRGLAALTVVMVLFFVMALVAAYTNRNLIFEQRISANNYRSARALAAADGGVDWTLALLNGGRVNNACEPSVDPADDDFRSRYLATGGNDPAIAEGGYEVATWGGAANTKFFPACIGRDGALTCVCPSAAVPTPALAPPADGIGSSHRITFLLPGNAVRPGTIEFAARGCASPGSGDTACFAPTNRTPVVDALATTLTTAGLVRALPIAPTATLTAGGQITATAGGSLQVANGDAATGITAHAGLAINPTPASNFQGVGPGSEGRLNSDAALAALAAAPNDGWFRALFGMDPATYRRQPAVVRVACAAGCSRADLAAVFNGYPRNPIWVDGNLALDSAAGIGTVANPLMLIVTGTLTLSAAVDIVGFVHADAVNWSAGADAASLRGALVARTDFTATTTATLQYDRPVLDTIRLRYGSFVRAPGGWNLTTVNFN